MEQYQNHKENNRTTSYNQNGTQHKLLIYVNVMSCKCISLTEIILSD